MEFKTLKDIFSLIAAIFASIASLLLLGSGVLFIVLASHNATDFIVEGLRNGTINTTMNGTPEEVAQALQATLFPALAIVMFIIFAFALGGAILCFLQRGKDSEGLSIAVLVLGVLSGDIIVILAGVFGILSALDQRKKVSSSNDAQ